MNRLEAETQILLSISYQNTPLDDQTNNQLGTQLQSRCIVLATARIVVVVVVVVAVAVVVADGNLLPTHWTTSEQG